MIRAFVFDIGNVLLRFDFGVAIKRLHPFCKVPLAATLLEPIERIKNDYESGRIGRAEFLREVFSLLEFTGAETDFVAAWEDIFEENLPMTRLVGALHGRYPLYLLSNTSDIHVDYMLRRYPVFERFGDAVYSYRVGCSKPDRAIYEMAAAQFKIEPGETVFIDDLPANIAAAREAGFHAIQYDFRQHEALLEELERLGVTA